MFPKKSSLSKFIFIGSINLIRTWWNIFYSRINCFVGIIENFFFIFTFSSKKIWSSPRLHQGININNLIFFRSLIIFIFPYTKIIKIIICIKKFLRSNNFPVSIFFWSIKRRRIIICFSFYIFWIIQRSITILYFYKRSIERTSKNRIGKHLFSGKGCRSS